MPQSLDGRSQFVASLIPEQTFTALQLLYGAFARIVVTHLFRDLLSGRDEGRGPALARVVRPDDRLAVADAVVGHQ